MESLFEGTKLLLLLDCLLTLLVVLFSYLPLLCSICYTNLERILHSTRPKASYASRSSHQATRPNEMKARVIMFSSK
jgi:hypothetical protein